MAARLECGRCDNFVPDGSQPFISKNGRRGSCSDETTGVKVTFSRLTPIKAAINNGVFTKTMVSTEEALARINCFKNSQPDTGIHEKRAISCILQKIPIT